MKEFILLPLSEKFFPSISSWASSNVASYSTNVPSLCYYGVRETGGIHARVWSMENWDRPVGWSWRKDSGFCTDIFLLSLYTGFEVVIRIGYTQHKVTHTGLWLVRTVNSNYLATMCTEDWSNFWAMKYWELRTQNKDFKRNTEHVKVLIPIKLHINFILSLGTVDSK